MISRHETTSQDEDLEGYEGLVDSAALVEEERTLLEVSGERAGQMLGGLLTCDVAKLGEREARYGFLLTPKGRPVAELRVLRLPGSFWLDLPMAAREGTLRHFEKFLPPRFARVEELGDRIRLGLVGPSAAGAWRSLGAGTRDAELPEPLRVLRSLIADAEVPAVGREPIEGPGADLYPRSGDSGPVREALVAAVRAVGGGAASPGAYDAWRVERGIPVYGREITEEVLPQETGQEDRAIAFDKGCYTGQEVVARIHYRGHVNRLLRGISLEGGTPKSGAPLFRGEKEVGSVTTSVRSPRLGPIALAYVRREIEPGERLRVGAPEGPCRATVQLLPFTVE